MRQESHVCVGKPGPAALILNSHLVFQPQRLQMSFVPSPEQLRNSRLGEGREVTSRNHTNGRGKRQLTAREGTTKLGQQRRSAVDQLRIADCCLQVQERLWGLPLGTTCRKGSSEGMRPGGHESLNVVHQFAKSESSDLGRNLGQETGQMLLGSRGMLEDQVLVSKVCGHACWGQLR